MVVIANHLKQKNYPKGILFPISNLQDNYISYDTDGFPWRLIPFIPNSKTLSKIKNSNQAFLAAQTFSEFYAYTWDINPIAIEPSIPNFLDFQKRIDDYELALQNATINRREIAAKEIHFINKHIQLPNNFISLLKSGSLPTRIIHADPKLSNILFDTLERQTLAVIDLDTIMPGTILYDYGDMIRSYTNNYKEDHINAENIFNPSIFDAVTQGFLYHIKDKLTSTELENLTYAAQVVVYTQALRFLTDYLNNDVYYSIEYPNQNLNRTINQIHLLQELLAL
ncbi:predicted protein [Nematostella vectensis]|uniref:Aminoglycoside phosphotransferase domain-containing protein n=1 Tax=Nematostella vectensis TaxID=45351 RepID=A7TB39_NEMVE|nr:predicted protein [Nematostella vectensis]|eukprot:XP_001618878.1 hypothetical protein NEMVEDRAFT_v1g224733 [Nematostella vectensis]